MQRTGTCRGERAAHLAGEANLKEAFERLVETGLRLNELKSEAELREFLVDEVTELSGADRVLLVLELPEGPQIAGSLLPPGESEADLLRAVTPWLDDARHTRSATLRHGPEGADASTSAAASSCRWSRSAICSASSTPIIDGLLRPLPRRRHAAAGRCSRRRPALTLANVRAAEALERKVVERTAEARAAQSQAEQRAAELAVINSIQQGMAAELDFQAIVDLVGDKLREVFSTGDIGIRWYDDPGQNLVHYLYEYEHGVAHLPARRRRRSQVGSARLLQDARSRMVVNTAAACVAAGTSLRCRAPTRANRSVMVPIIGSDRVLGAIVLENYERENAFGEAGDAPAADRGRQHGRGAGERPPVRRDPAPAQGDRAAQRRAGDHQQRAAGAGRRAEHAGHLRRRRRQDPRDLPSMRMWASASTIRRRT